MYDSSIATVTYKITTSKMVKIEIKVAKDGVEFNADLNSKSNSELNSGRKVTGTDAMAKK